MVLPKRLWLCLILLFTGAVAQAVEPNGLTVTSAIKTKVDAGMTLVGKWGTFINGKSYQQMPLDTFKGWQYTTYYDQKGRLSIARRKLPDGAWQTIHFDDYLFEGNDNHNVTVLGICRNDGTIHLSFDHHCGPLHYRVSKSGVVSNPGDVQWDASLFSEVRDYLQRGKQIESVTYPQFVPTPQGNLLFFSRHGNSTNGRVTLCEYAPEKGGWGERRNITSSEGTYVFEEKTSKKRNAYLNGVHYGNTGRLHISWCWRENMGSVFRDVYYAYSDDGGREWFNSGGERIGGPDEPISMNSPGIKVWDVSPHQGQEVMMGQCVDAKDRPHIVISRLRDGEEPLSLGERDPSRSAYYHYWRDDKGTWHQNEMSHPLGGEADSERNRAKILATPDNDLIAMFNNHAKIVLMSATAEAQYRDWKVIHEEEGPWNGEPLPDLSRWREEGLLSIYMQKNPTKDGEPTDLYIVDFTIAAKGTTRKNRE